MRLFALLICELLASRNGQGGRRRIQRKNGPGTWALTSGMAKPNPNLSNVNNLNGVGCQIIEVEDEYTMAIGGYYLKRFTNCGRCARVTCVGNACPTDGKGNPTSIVARIITQTTIMSDDKDVELNIAAWTTLMGARATLPGMSVSWAYESCPEPKDGRKKIYIHEDTNDKTYIVQPVNFPDPVKYMKFKNSAPKSKFSKPKSPLKGKLGYFGYIGKVKGKAPMKPPIFVDILMNDEEGTRIKTKMTSWEPGKFSFPDGLPPDDSLEGPTQTKNDNMNFHVLGDIFGGQNSTPKKPTKPAKTTTAEPTTTTTVKTTTVRTRPSRKPKTTRAPRTKKPKKSKNKVMHDEGNTSESFEMPSFFGPPQPARQESQSKHDALGSFIFDILSPFEITDAPTTTVPVTTTTPQPKYNDIGPDMKFLTGWGAPTNAHSGSCNSRKVKDTKLFVSINKKLNANACNWCVFVYCPGYAGCSGKPLTLQVVDEFEGEGDFALSADAFKYVTGKGMAKRDRVGLYKSITRIVKC